MLFFAVGPQHLPLVAEDAPEGRLAHPKGPGRTLCMIVSHESVGGKVDNPVFPKGMIPCRSRAGSWTGGCVVDDKVRLKISFA